MDKKTILKFVNILLAITFFMTASGGILRTFVPDLVPYDKFAMFHPKVGTAFVIFAILHIALNWGWVRATFFKKNSTK